VKEADIEEKFGGYVKSNGGLYLKQNAGLYANVPDRAVFKPGGLAFLLELKRPGEEPRPGQDKWARMARRRGHFVYWADSVEEAVQIYETFSVSVPKKSS
jgi:hypothetical protein